MHLKKKLLDLNYSIVYQIFATALITTIYSVINQEFLCNNNNKIYKEKHLRKCQDGISISLKKRLENIKKIRKLKRFGFADHLFYKKILIGLLE